MVVVVVKMKMMVMMLLAADADADADDDDHSTKHHHHNFHHCSSPLTSKASCLPTASKSTTFSPPFFPSPYSFCIAIMSNTLSSSKETKPKYVTLTRANPAIDRKQASEGGEGGLAFPYKGNKGLGGGEDKRQSAAKQGGGNGCGGDGGVGDAAAAAAADDEAEVIGDGNSDISSMTLAATEAAASDTSVSIQINLFCFGATGRGCDSIKRYVKQCKISAANSGDI
jgi:hypothetical protein